MKTKIFALICAALMLSAAAPVVIADTGSDAPDIIVSNHKRPAGQTQSDNKQAFDVKSEEGSYMPVTDKSVDAQGNTGLVSMDLINYFREQTENFAETIDVSDFFIEYDPDTFNELYEMLVYCSPKSYYLLSDNGMYSYFYPETENGFITYIYPIYTKYDTTDENLSIYDVDMYIDTEKLKNVKAYDKIEEKQSEFDKTIAEIKSRIPQNASDFEKLLAFHDYIVMNYKYSWDDLYKPNLSDRTHNTVMSLIDTGEGLCESFSVLFNYLAMDAGLDTGFITSYDSANNTAYHTWNMVKLAMPGSKDQNWYNIDVTWDENLVERTIGEQEHQKDEGRTDFTNFLMSDDLTQESHILEGVSYANPQMTDDKSLDEIEWKGSDSQIVNVNGASYFIDYPDTGKPALYRTNGNKTEKVFEDFKVLWDHANNTAYSGLSYFDGSLFFNDAENIYEYHLATGNVTSTKILNNVESSSVSAAGESRSRGEQIYSSYKKDNKLYYCTASVEDDELTLIASTGNKTYKTGIDVLSMPKYNENGNVEFTLSSDLNKKVIAAVKTSDGTIIEEGIRIKPNNIGSMTYEFENIPNSDVEVIMWDYDSMKPITKKTTLKAK